VAFDLDGTVADMASALRLEAQALFGEEITAPAKPRSGSPTVEVSTESAPELPFAEIELTARQQVLLWDRVKQIENFWTTLPELEAGIIARIAKTAEARRWEVLFITTRPSTAGETTQLQSQRWLHAHGFPFPSVYVVQRSRGRLADALGLDALVDDRPENCLDVAVESQAKVLLVWPGPMSEIPGGARRLGVEPVATISDAVSFLERMDDARRQSSVVRKLRRMLGRPTAGER
jgi:hypothetical protein